MNQQHTATAPAVLLALALCIAGTPASAQRPIRATEKTPSQLITPPAQRAIDRGLAYLGRRQLKSGREKGSFGRGGYASGVAVSGLAGLAFMCGGSPPDQGLYGAHVNHCVGFLMRNTRETGYIATSSGRDNMYGHGFATLFLSEVYGMSQDQQVGRTLRKAINLIVDCQNSEGGWRYQPRENDADLSVTICQIMALRAARDAGVHVPDEVRQKCINYVKRSQNPDGGFRYQIRGGGSTFPLTAAGLVSLYSAGIYESPEVNKGLQHLLTYLPGSGRGASHYFYAHYYAVQAMWHAGGTHWDRWYPAIRSELLSKQQGDGSWTDPSVGPEFGTAMACIILQMPNNYLPVFAP